ncbi:PRD domain-containing protein [Lacrimispora sp.]|uniref:PRD domain-containing protein n=1 Tax=Lacrimispora sp. TaxID=2719234 RepID=UPI0034616D41
MRVVKVMNNSLLLALDDSGREVILMGKGIGFNKSIGHRLKSEDIEKVFVLKDRSVSKNIIRLASEIDSTYFELAKQVIDYAIDTYGMVLMEHIYLGLTDHLSFAVKRNNEGILIQNFYTQTLKRFNPKEYQVGLYALKLMRERLQVELPEDEAGNIAFHFINAQTNHLDSMDNQKIFETVKGILDIVKYNFSILYDEDGIGYTRFVTHLRLFAQRLVNGNQDIYDYEDSFYTHVLEKCPREYECVKKIGIFIKEKFDSKLSKQEEMYLAVHIHRILEEYAQRKKI